jgi:MarR family transcriptional regulator, organic hydroperoxide resistance regulator
MDAYNEFQLKNTLNWLLIRASFLAKQGLVKLAEKHNLTLAQVFAICLLEPGKAEPMKVLAQQMSCDASTASGIVDRLLELGYIDRHEAKHDRRVKNIELTTTGKKLRKTLLEQIQANSSSALANLTEDEAASLRILLTKLLNY